MPRVTCPSCRGVAEVDPADVGEDVTCPTCGDVFRARVSTRRDDDPFEQRPARSRRDADDDLDDRPRRRRSRRDDDDEDDFDDRPRRRRRRRSREEEREEIVEDAYHAVFLPALFSIFANAISLLYLTVDAILIIMDPQLLKQGPFGGGANVPVEAIIAVRAVMLLWVIVCIVGSVLMMKLKARQFVLVSMVMNIIPCSGVCCLLCLPVGVWGLVTVLRPDVVEGFELNEA